MAGRNRPAIGADKRLALNRMGSFDWDLLKRTLDLDAAGLAVFDLRPGEYDGNPETLSRRVPPEEGIRLDATVDRAIRSGRTSYGAYFQVTRRNGIRQWTHVRGRILRDAQGSPHRVIGIVRNATTELTEFAEVSAQEAGRRRLTGIVQGTTEALSRALTVDDVTAVLSDVAGLERFGAEGLALGLVDGGAVRLVALSGESLETAGERPVAPLDDARPLARAALTQRAHFATSLPGPTDDRTRPRPHIDGHGFDAAAFLPLVAQARSIGGLALFTGAAPTSRPRTATSVSAWPASSPSRSSARSSSTRNGSSPPDSSRPCCRATSPPSAASRSRCATTPPGAAETSAATGTT